MQKITIEPYSISFDNTVCTGERIHFSPAFHVDLGQLHSSDTAENKSSGSNQFRVDYTKVGRYECEFLDHTYGYRGEGEVTLLATPRGPEWAQATSIPTGIYNGCAIVIFLDKLTPEDEGLFEKLGIDLERTIRDLDVDQRWYKFTDSAYFVRQFGEIYAARAAQNKEAVFLKALDILLHIARLQPHHAASMEEQCFFPAGQVKVVKELHACIVAHYTENISFEALLCGRSISYSVFNRVFKAVYGESPYQYLKKIRINQAAKSLVETDLSVLEIGAQVGYANPSKFSAAFRAVTGVLPSAYRRQKRNGVFGGGLG